MLPIPAHLHRPSYPLSLDHTKTHRQIQDRQRDEETDRQASKRSSSQAARLVDCCATDSLSNTCAADKVSMQTATDTVCDDKGHCGLQLASQRRYKHRSSQGTFQGHNTC